MNAGTEGVCARFVVSGRVQGVGFRYATADTAKSLRARGWVRNLPDGSVELVACADADGLNALERWLWQGPPLSKVTAVAREPVANSGFVEFTIR